MAAVSYSTRALVGPADTFLTILVAACADGRAAGWCDPVPSADGQWLDVDHADSRMPEQGWKVHVSAALDSATEVLRRVLPVLLAEPCHFKVAATPLRLYALNTGEGGRSQVGKFITVYPADDTQAVRLAVALEQATCGLRGPAIPSDRPLRPGSLVHYRYGAFTGRTLQLPHGEVVSALTAPDGTLEPDRRGITYTVPAWAADPFVAAGVVERGRPVSLVIAGRFLTVEVLQHSPRGIVRRVVEIASGERRVLKQARRDCGLEAEGDGRRRLCHEAAVLRSLTPDPRVPAVLDLFEHDGDQFLLLEDCPGRTLEQVVMDLAAWGRSLPVAEIIRYGCAAAELLAAVHERGLVHADVKPANMICSPEGEPRLVDWETAAFAGAREDGPVAGTTGYLSPARAAGARPTETDDIYSLGASLYYLATGAEPAHAPRPARLLDRPVPLLNPAVGPELAAVIARCLAPDPAARYPSMAAVQQALEHAGAESEKWCEQMAFAPVRLLARATVPCGGTTMLLAPPARTNHLPGVAEQPVDWEGETAMPTVHTYRALAERLGEALARAVTAEPGQTSGITYRDLGKGLAGTVAALAALTAAFPQPDWRQALRAGAQRLNAMPPLPGGPLPGLYVGEAGIGAALLLAGLVLDDRDLIGLAEERSRQVAALPHNSPDLFNGSAGRLRFHLLVYDATGNPEHLRAAVAAGDRLLVHVESGTVPAGNGRPDREQGNATPLPALRADEICWRMPPGYSSASAIAYLGYAHGAAGIGDALLDLWDVTGDRRFAAAAAAAGRLLLRLARPALDEDHGLDWPVTADGNANGPLWCHGAGGIARFFLHATRAGILPDVQWVAQRAAWAAARGARWAGPSQCHGLAGNIETVLDQYQQEGDPVWLAEAAGLAELLQAFACERDGLLLWPSDQPGVVTPDLLTGYAGVATCLLRLGDPAGTPHLLSRAGFRALTGRCLGAARPV